MTPDRTGLGTGWMCSVQSALRGLLSLVSRRYHLPCRSSPIPLQQPPDLSIGDESRRHITAKLSSSQYDDGGLWEYSHSACHGPLTAWRLESRTAWLLQYRSVGSEVQKPPYGFWFIEPPKYGLGGPAIVGNTLSSITYDAYHNQSDGYSARAYYVYEDGWGIGQQHPRFTTAGLESIDGSGISSIVPRTGRAFSLAARSKIPTATRHRRGSGALVRIRWGDPGRHPTAAT